MKDQDASNVAADGKRSAAEEATKLVEYIKTYAKEHYNDGGWDVIVECWEDGQILDWLVETEALTKEEAVKAFMRLVGVWADRQADARNSAF